MGLKHVEYASLYLITDQLWTKIGCWRTIEIEWDDLQRVEVEGFREIFEEAVV